MMFRNTLTLRLVLTSGVWVAVTLVAIGVLLSWLFRQQIEQRFDTLLASFLHDTVAASEISPGGELHMTWTPANPDFELPFSGWYWQVFEDGEPTAQSRSLWRERLEVSGPGLGAGPRIREFNGPGGAALRGLVQDITLPDSGARFTFAVAGPVSNIAADVGRFTKTSSLTLAVLAIGLMVAILLQVRVGLRPLRSLQSALAAIRAGKAERLPEAIPAEVQGIVAELNALLAHNASLLERARTQAGNLAHALKNPLTVIRNEASEIEGERGRILRDETSTMTAYVNRYLSRVRAAGTQGLIGSRVRVSETAEDLRFSLGRLYEARRLDIDLIGLDGLSFRGDAGDFEEMLGNLMDNACKWARSRVDVSGKVVGNRLSIAVDDDGAGIREGHEIVALRRGHRLDEAVPGSGLGLDIVQDIAELYRGALRLEVSPLGGVRAILDLPAAD